MLLAAGLYECIIAGWKAVTLQYCWLQDFKTALLLATRQNSIIAGCNSVRL
jgi:hypothetical protein